MQISNHLQEVSQKLESRPKSRELAIAESPLPQTSNKFAVAIDKPKISQLTNIEPLKESLRVAMIIVGLRGQNFPNELEKALLINHIVRYYGGHTPEEIRLAFELAVCSELELSFEEVTAYENFTIIYFSKIMTAYRKWAEVQYRQVVKDEVPNQVTYSDADLENLHRGDVEAFYQRCLRGVVPDVTPAYFKAILVKDGLMKDGESLPNFFVQRMGVGAKNIYTKG